MPKRLVYETLKAIPSKELYQLVKESRKYKPKNKKDGKNREYNLLIMESELDRRNNYGRQIGFLQSKGLSWED